MRHYVTIALLIILLSISVSVAEDSYVPPTMKSTIALTPRYIEQMSLTSARDYFDKGDCIPATNQINIALNFFNKEIASIEERKDYLQRVDYEFKIRVEQNNLFEAQTLENQINLSCYSSDTIVDNHIEQVNDEQLFKLLNEYIAKAKVYLITPDCDAAAKAISQAKAIRSELNARKLDRENEPQQMEGEMYRAPDQLISIEATFEKLCSNNKRMIMTSEDFYVRAQDYYLKPDYDGVWTDYNTALSYANKSLAIYKQTKNYVGISKTETLIAQIKLRQKTASEADEHVKKARGYMASKDFESAKGELADAKQMYRQMGLTKQMMAVATLEANISQTQNQQEIDNIQKEKNDRLMSLPSPESLIYAVVIGGALLIAGLFLLVYLIVFASGKKGKKWDEMPKNQLEEPKNTV